MIYSRSWFRSYSSKGQGRQAIGLSHRCSDNVSVAAQLAQRNSTQNRGAGYHGQSLGSLRQAPPQHLPESPQLSKVVISWEPSIQTHEPVKGTLALEGYFDHGKGWRWFTEPMWDRNSMSQKKKRDNCETQGLERGGKKGEGKGGFGAAGILAAPLGSLQSKEIWQHNHTPHPAKALLAAPNGHLCEHRSREEAATLHVF